MSFVNLSPNSEKLLLELVKSDNPTLLLVRKYAIIPLHTKEQHLIFFVMDYQMLFMLDFNATQMTVIV